MKRVMHELPLNHQELAHDLLIQGWSPLMAYVIASRAACDELLVPPLPVPPREAQSETKNSDTNTDTDSGSGNSGRAHADNPVSSGSKRNGRSVPHWTASNYNKR